MIELVVYPKGSSARLINPSPFCSKSEIFLKMAKIDFKKEEFTGNPSKFPNKKLPVLRDGAKLIADTSFIQKYLEDSLNINLDGHLSALDKSYGFAFTKMLEEYFYWSLLHERWFIDENWEKLKSGYFGHIPSLIRGLVTNMIRKGTMKSAVGHGMGRHCDENILGMGKESIKALSDFLGEKNYLLGDKISSYDSTSFAFVSSILHSTLGPILRNEALKYENLINYDERMFQLLF